MCDGSILNLNGLVNQGCVGGGRQLLICGGWS